ncbi:hypothetical protein Hanom_Chr17g01555651 [Helianthus anomalus]
MHLSAHKTFSITQVTHRMHTLSFNSKQTNLHAANATHYYLLKVQLSDFDRFDLSPF